MKKRIIGIILGTFILSIAAVFGVATTNKKTEKVQAYYSPSTTYEVSDTASELASYYSSISDSDIGTSLLSKLQSLNNTKRKKTMGYGTIGTDMNGAVIYTDYDLNSTAKDSNGQTYGTKVASFYTKTAATGWNREHMWPNSHGGNNVEADILHTRPTISSENSSRGNSFYVEGKNSSSAGWDPYTAGYDAEVRGECARVILYCVVAYSGFTLSDADSHSTSNSNKDNMMGNMNTLIKWHFDYAPNVYEMNRNNGAEYLQGNRNPFVDHPEYVARIWSNFNSTVSTLCSNNESKYSNWTPGNYCDYGSNTPVTPNEGVEISSTSESVTVGSTTTLSATASNSGTITWTTSNSSIASLSSTSSSSGSSIIVRGVAAGTATITASATIGGTQYSKTCTVTVTKVVSSLSKGSTSPTKTTYNAGESFDPTGLTITAIYSDSTYDNVTSSVVWTPNPLTAGTTSVTGTFGGKTVTVSGLTVNVPTEPEIIDNNSDLSVGDYVVIRTAEGVGVTGWNNNKDATVSETESAWKRFYVASASNSGFTLKDETANNFIANPGSSNQFTYGSAGTCSTDSSGHLICNNRYLCKNGTNYRFYTSISSYLPFFIYKVPSSSPKTLSSISVSTAPTKTAYTAGEYFDPTGLVITRTYSDSSSDTYTYSGHESEFSFTPALSTALTTDNTSITITYSGKSTSQAITVNAPAKTLSSISISGQTTSFTVDDEFEFGGTVTAHFSDSSSSDVTASATFTGYDMSTSGEQTVTVSYTYGGITETSEYQITVNSSGGGGGESVTGSQRVSARDSSSYHENGDIVFSGDNASQTTSCDAFTASWLKNESTNNISNTYNEIRLYTKHSLTITPNEDYTITSVVITANNATYASNVGESALTNCVKETEGTTVTLTPLDGTSAFGFTNSSQSRLNYFVVNYTYGSSGEVEQPTSITATVKDDRTFYVGETIIKSDITVMTDTNLNVTSAIEFADYQFTYSDAPSGGAVTNKVFDITYSDLPSTSLTVKVQRKAYATPSGSASFDLVSSTIFKSIGGGNNNLQSGTVEYDGITYQYKDAYYHSSGVISFGNASNQTGHVVNVTAFPSSISDVTVTSTGREVNVRYSTDGSSWVLKANANTSATDYRYMKIDCSGNTGSNYSNISKITVSLKSGDTAVNAANYIMFEDTNNQCLTKLSVAISYLNTMNSVELNVFQTSEDYVIASARERLEAWANSQGKTVDYSGGESEVTLSSALVNELTDSLESNNALILIIACALGSMLCLSTLLIIKKKKRK